ncbi:hypothetical protein [Ruegeria arenilitoris]|uniref:hypothetical protein n=1 Tax=Ruegeria arenilitoris TaxID=1173585 RepID=UPI00147C85B9|nr:hypothetical protein [Ruegeria arenilitoris]
MTQNLSLRELSILVCSLPIEHEEVSCVEQAMQVGSEYGRAWYANQKEHWIGWLADYEGPGAYVKVPNGNVAAENVYRRMVCTPAIFWLVVQSASIGRTATQALVTSILADPNAAMARHSAWIRRTVPWDSVQSALLNRAPISKEEFSGACATLRKTQEKLRIHCYSQKAWAATQEFEQTVDEVEMDIKKIILSLPSRSIAQRQIMRKNAEKLIGDGSNEKRSAARQLISALDELEEREREALNRKLSGMKPAERVIHAFIRVPPSETETRLIRVLMDHPGSTSTELSRALGWDAQTWHLHFGTMCKSREADLWPADPSDIRDASFYSGILANFDKRTASWELKPEVEAAFRDLGI